MDTLDSLYTQAEKFEKDEREDVRQFATACKLIIEGQMRTIDITPLPLTKDNRFMPAVDVEDNAYHQFIFLNQHAVPCVAVIIDIQGSIDHNYWYTIHQLQLSSGSHERVEFQGAHRYVRAVVKAWIAPWSASVSAFDIQLRYFGNNG